MGLTAVGITYSPLGKRSGAHFNPAVTFAFCRLGKVDPVDAAAYVVAQFAGGVGGMLLAAEAVLRRRGAGAGACAKLHHENPLRYIFRCGYHGRAS
jgi:glycerol uptake facilitator-like aquaporin